MSVLRWLFPGCCIFCGARTEEVVCPRCQNTLPWYPQERGGGEVFAPLYYRGAAREALHRFKFEGALYAARPLSGLMCQCVRAGDYDSVCWVPSSLRRRLQRGYDHSRLLARPVAARLGLPLCPALRRVRHGAAQFTLTDAAARQANVRGAYAITRRGRESVNGLRILLIDDIHTTGATFGACRDALLAAGAAAVTLLCAARKK